MSVTLLPPALRELTGLLADIELRNQRAAEKVGRRITETLDLLDANPYLGTEYATAHPALAGIRYMTVKQYRQFVVLYRPVPGGVEVHHIIRGRRNLRAVLEGDV